MKRDLAKLIQCMFAIHEASYEPAVWTEDDEAGRLIASGGFYHIHYYEAAQQAAAELGTDPDLIQVAIIMSSYIGDSIEWSKEILAKPE